MADKRQILGLALNRSMNDAGSVIRTKTPHHLELCKRRAHAQERVAGFPAAKLPAVPNDGGGQPLITRQLSHAHRMLVSALRQRPLWIHRRTDSLGVMNQKECH